MFQKKNKKLPREICTIVKMCNFCNSMKHTSGNCWGELEYQYDVEQEKKEEFHESLKSWHSNMSEKTKEMVTKSILMSPMAYDYGPEEMPDSIRYIHDFELQPSEQAREQEKKQKQCRYCFCFFGFSVESQKLYLEREWDEPRTCKPCSNERYLKKQADMV
jgi:hypothetical protein